MRYLQSSAWLFKAFVVFLSLYAVRGDAGTDPSRASVTLFLSIDGNFVNADIQGAPLTDVMNHLALQVDLELYVSPSAGRKKIFATFNGLSLESAIKHLLKGTNYALVYIQNTDKSVTSKVHNLKRVYVASSGSGSSDVATVTKSENVNTSQRVALRQPLQELPQADDDTGSLVLELGQKIMQNAEPNDRIAELRALVSEYGEGGLPLVLAARMDPNDEVRMASVSLLLNDLREVVPNNSLIQLAINDENPSVRIEAMELLAGRPHENEIIRSTLELALEDPDPGVQKIAHDLLTRFSGKEE